MNDNEVQCPHCAYVCDIGGLIGETTDNCPRCGDRALSGAVTTPDSAQQVNPAKE